MHQFQCKAGPDSNGEKRGQTDPAQPAPPRMNYYSDLIKRADSVPLAIILKHYGYRTENQNKKFVCPFPSHQNGRESTPSFQYYFDTDTFKCFGCSLYGKGTQFVATKEDISRSKAASKILELYADEVLEDGYETKQINYSERLEILMEFSAFVREFIQSHPADIEALRHIEQITFVLDKMNENYMMENSALKLYLEELKTKVRQ